MPPTSSQEAGATAWGGVAHHAGEVVGGAVVLATPPCYARAPRGSAWEGSVTEVSSVAVTTDPYRGQRRFQVSTSPSACSGVMPHISKDTRRASKTVRSPGLVSGSR